MGITPAPEIYPLFSEIQTKGFCTLKQILLKEGDRPVKIQSLEKA
ncbi:MAG: hypothetical protein Q4E86_01430 [Lachnospiraceae bacterium]|nr:hypothetical protein [Lachnospiraceae bacterium]